jgi:hypothetical protein
MEKLSKRGVKFEIYKEGNVKTDERVFLSAMRVRRSLGSKILLATCCLCLKRKNESYSKENRYRMEGIDGCKCQS